MTYEEIMNLVNAGFNRDEILRLAGMAAAPAPDPEPAPAPAPAPDPEPSPAPAPAPEPQPAPAPAPAPVAQPQDMLGQILGKFDEMSRSMQELAIKNSQQPKPETADDILAAIIRPPRKE